MAKKNEGSEYVKLSQREHVLQRPDSYVGSKSTVKQLMFIVKDNNLNDIQIEKKAVNYNPAFIKLFDEILTNASDQAIRTGKVKMIKIMIDDSKISIENDGPSIPIKIHPKEKVYNQELIFSTMLTGQNFDDTKDRFVGGKNGMGSKLTNIYSKKFIVECCDGKERYKQTIKNNMADIGVPEITKVKDTKSYTKITYYPDYDQFDFNNLTEDLKSIMYKRCIDVAAYIPNVRISLNGKTIPVKSVKDFMKMHLEDDVEFFHEKLKNGWEVGIAKSSTEQFENVSIVNGITTYKGGTHVSHVINQLSKDIVDKFGKNVNANWVNIKNRIFLFLVCKIPNPEFDTQTKENMTKNLTIDIHQKCYVSTNNVKKIMKSEIVQSILDEIELKEAARLKRMQKQKKKLKVEKLIDANSKDRSKCQLFIFEGDSAENGARQFRDPQIQGMFKLKGKFANVRKMSDNKMIATAEVLNLMAAIGLTLNEPVVEADLQFNEILITTDMDCVDGNTLVATDNGNKKIKDVNIDDKVLTHNNEYKKVKRVVEQEKTSYVKVKINGEYVNFSENHKMIIHRDGEIQEILAKDLKYSDNLLLNKK